MSSAANEELELKYAIDDPGAVRRWLDTEFPPSADEHWSSRTITDRYFDAADGTLAGAGYGARLRRTGGRTTLTLKSDIAVDGALHRREELEGPATKLLDPSSWPHSAARDRLLALCGDKLLIERFSVRVRRRERSLTSGGGVYSASIDQGRVEAAGVDAGPIRQLELEWKSGRREGIELLGRTAEESGIARAEPRSKLTIAAEMSADAARVNQEDEFAEAGRKVLRRHLLRMLERETATRTGDAVALKQMRVATRRMRAAWRVFADAYRKGTRRRFADELRRIGQALGCVRDLDVQIDSVGNDKRLPSLVTYLYGSRVSATAALLKLLDSEDFHRFVDDSLAFTSSPGEGATRAGRTPVRRAATAALQAAFERLVTAGSVATARNDDDAWHGVRIEGRRFRYSLEAFADVAEPDATAELHRRAVSLQDHLGAINDAAVQSESISSWLAASEARGLDGAARRAAAEYVAARRAHVAELRASLAPVWAAVSDSSARELLAAALEPLTRS